MIEQRYHDLYARLKQREEEFEDNIRKLLKKFVKKEISHAEFVTCYEELKAKYGMSDNEKKFRDSYKLCTARLTTKLVMAKALELELRYGGSTVADVVYYGSNKVHKVARNQLEHIDYSTVDSCVLKVLKANRIQATVLLKERDCKLEKEGIAL